MGTKGLGAADGDDGGVQGRQQVGHQVAGDGPLLIDGDPQAGQEIGREGIAVAAAIPLGSIRIGRGGHGGRQRLGNGAEGGQGGGFFGLGDLAVGPLELQAVAIVGKVAARDHDGAGAAPHRFECKRRGRQRTAIDDPEARRRRRVGKVAAMPGLLSRRLRPMTTLRSGPAVAATERKKALA